VHADIGDDAAGRHDILASDKARGHADRFDGGIDAAAAVIFMIFSTALPSLLLMIAVAPKREDNCRRLSSISTMIVSAGE
jgi:hypothetical protein